MDGWNLSEGPCPFNQEAAPTDIISASSWKTIGQEMCDAFYDRYKQELGSYDAFLVSRVPALSLLFEKFHKPIIVLCAGRYETPFSNDLARWSKLNKYLSSGMVSGSIFPIATNKYDAAYFKFFTFEDCVEVIPNYCEYTNSKYEGVYDNALYFSKFKCGANVNYMVDRDIVFGPNCNWKDLTRFKAIVHVPWDASQINIFEQYTAGIPLIFPTWEFLKALRAEYYDYGVLSELSLNQIRCLPSRSLLYCSSEEEDPNDYLNNEVMMKWTKLADYYDDVLMPELIYFKSLDQLYNIIDTYNFKEYSQYQLENVRNRKNLIYSKWAAVLGLVEEAT
jgi:hypothetical protein